MMTQISVQLEGMEEALRRLPDATRRRAASRQMLQRFGVLVAGEAARRAPVRSGTLRRSIQVEVNESGDRAVVGSILRYAPYMEFGTGLFGPKHERIVARPGHPFAWPVNRAGANDLRLSGTHRTAVTRSGKAAWAFAMSTQGSHPHPFMRTGYEGALPALPGVLEETVMMLLGGKP